MSDQLKKKRIENKSILAGKLMTLDNKTYGEDKNGKEYLSFKGAIQCGESPVLTRNFDFFTYKLKKDGTESKLYGNASQWVESAIPASVNAEQATMVEMSGSIADGTYVNSREELKEVMKYNMSMISKFTSYKCIVGLEGYIGSYTEELDGDDEKTGRMIMSILSQDYHKNPIILKKIIVRKEDVSNIDKCGYQEGMAGTVTASFVAVEDAAPSSGWGEQVTEGKSYSELVVIGCSNAVEIVDEGTEGLFGEDDIRNLKRMRKEYINEIKEKGYQGNKSGKDSPSTSAKKTSSAKKNSKISRLEEDDDGDLPF